MNEGIGLVGGAPTPRPLGVCPLSSTMLTVQWTDHTVNTGPGQMARPFCWPPGRPANVPLAPPPVPSREHTATRQLTSIWRRQIEQLVWEHTLGEIWYSRAGWHIFSRHVIHYWRVVFVDLCKQAQLDNSINMRNRMKISFPLFINNVCQHS